MLQGLGHVKWFNSVDPPQKPAFDIAELLAVAAIVIVGLSALWLINKWLVEHNITAKLNKKLKGLGPFVPLIVRLSTVAFLLINFVQQFLLAPNIPATFTLLPATISSIFIVAAGLIGLGLFTRVGVAALLLGYVLIFGVANNAIDVLDHFEYIGIAGYLWFRGPGIYSLDYSMRKGVLSSYTKKIYALDVYRIGVGIGLVTLALSEKIFNVTAAQDFLNQHSWNLLSSAGVSDRHFILVAGAVELLVGMALILNYAPRLLVTVVLSLMIVTAILLGVDEIYGHLFAVGLVVAIWVNDRTPVNDT